MSLSLMFWLLLAVQSPPQFDAPIVCDQCAAWNRDREPFKVFGNTYYVGVEGLSSVLITGDNGHILIDGALPQSAPLIDAHIRKLGFKTEDIRLIVTSHVHYDHVGGVAALQRASGAAVAASPSSARVLSEGASGSDDPQFGTLPRFPMVAKVRALQKTMSVGKLSVTTLPTPGHTPGGTTYTWRSCEGSRCLNIVYADSLNAVSADGFRFTPIAETFRKSIRAVEELPCDILIPVHPNFTNAFDAPQACRTYAANARQTLDRRLEQEKK
jgi:metallo-beta-lactamase class B